jgi:hypothetical protein
MELVNDLPKLTSTPIVAAYLAVVIGVRLVSSHKPMNFPYLMLVYNSVATVASFVTMVLFLHSLLVSSQHPALRSVNDYN